MERISVIITVYNLENFVGEAIESVLSQTRRPDEIIVVDDGSKDRSVEVISEYGNRVQLIEMGKNQGVLPAFMAGIKASTGEILAFLDGDDVWMPDKLEKILREFRQDPNVMMVTHLHEHIDKYGQPTGLQDATHVNLKKVTEQAGEDNHLLDRLLKNSILSYKGVWLGSAFCIRRRNLNIEQYENWVNSLPGKNLSHQDQPLAAYLIYANQSRRIAFINKPLFKYRVYETNSSGASVDVASALRTLERSIATVSRTQHIVSKNPQWKEENNRQKYKLKELLFYKHLYQKEYGRAGRHYLDLFLHFWDWNTKFKEAKRLFVCVILGPAKFLRLKTNKRFS